jgi:tetratricopeptide (TPR) repeat protein
MGSRRWRSAATAMAATLAAGIAAAAAPPPTAVRLTVETPAFVLAHDGTAGGLLLRELQRQAVLLAAREELGLATRDAVLGEPGGRGAVTLRAQTRVWRGSRAELRLSVAKATADRPWVSFPISDDPLVDYPAFITACEAASRGPYLDALRAVVGTGRRPTAWADGPADPMAVTLLGRMDVFSQLLAVRRIHAQLRSAGASVDRLSALVRGYADLGELTGDDWSADCRAYAARSLLYAERLVAHEHGSAPSLYARAYAEGMADLSAAALADLDGGARAGPAGRPPVWAAVLRAYCRRDLPATAGELAAGPADVRSLAGFLSAIASFDDHPTADIARATLDALAVDPGPLVLMTAVATVDDPLLSKLHESAVGILTVLAREQLRGPSLPPDVAAALAAVEPSADDGSPDFAGLARLRDALRQASQGDDPSEPSWAAVGSLVEQQAFLAVVTRAASLRQAGDPAETAKYVAAAGPVLQAHPWGPYVEAMAVDGAANPRALRQRVDGVPAAAVGPWADRAAEDLTLDDATEKLLARRWGRPAHVLSDPTVGDYSPGMATEQAARDCGGDLAGYLGRVRRTDPHTALLTAAWMEAVGPERAAADDSLFEPAVAQVEAEFADRPTVVARAADWCQARGQFDRELALLRGIDAVEPTPAVCERLARVARRAGHPEAAVAYCVRSARLAGGNTDDADDGATRLVQLAAADLIADGHLDEAMAFLHRGGGPSDARGLGLMARCDERMGRLDEAESCLRQASAVAPMTVVQYALWARRLGRATAGDVHAKAVATVAQPGGPAPGVTMRQAAYYLATADGQPGPALDVLRQAWEKGQLSDATDLGRLAAAAAGAGDAGLARKAIDAARGPAADEEGRPFGHAFAALADAPTTAGVAAFDRWCDRQLDDERAVAWHAVAGQYLLATGHPAEARSELAIVLASPAHEQADYFIAWQAMKRMGAATRP